MRREQAVLVLALLFLGEFVMAYTSLSGEQAQTSSQRFAISEHGTLLEVFDANGKSRFGKIVGDGFDVRYEIRGKTMAASAIGTKIAGLQRGQVKLDGQSATAIVKTSDSALEITSYFVLDESATRLIIGRRFRNVSSNPIFLQMVRDYVAPTLVVAGQPRSNHSVDFVQLALGRIRAGRTGGLPADCYPIGECVPPPPPPCLQITCPLQDKFAPAHLLTGLKGRPNEIALRWQDRVALEPMPPMSGRCGATPLPPNESFILVHISLGEYPARK
jgi:hypothetical protein